MSNHPYQKIHVSDDLKNKTPRSDKRDTDYAEKIFYHSGNGHWLGALRSAEDAFEDEGVEVARNIDIFATKNFALRLPKFAVLSVYGPIEESVMAAYYNTIFPAVAAALQGKVTVQYGVGYNTVSYPAPEGLFYQNLEVHPQWISPFVIGSVIKSTYGVDNFRMGGFFTFIACGAGYDRVQTFSTLSLFSYCSAEVTGYTLDTSVSEIESGEVGTYEEHHIPVQVVLQGYSVPLEGDVYNNDMLSFLDGADIYSKLGGIYVSHNTNNRLWTQYVNGFGPTNERDYWVGGFSGPFIPGGSRPNAYTDVSAACHTQVSQAVNSGAEGNPGLKDYGFSYINGGTTAVEANVIIKAIKKFYDIADDTH